ncbi:MAG TPA: response regulator transcription factor [Shinella sp.]|uniref:helix-turn-helix transcriptional regulator n=1 Tax=Shinella sp. TaxID=1870904 RepID=UPI0029B86E79|nr:response regulator transcription factor [Shinella sp.]MDX3973404.1 response regulator transcription factor [Shinella sp.]HEV7250947.1 response regulator transcription factor [Shinella sp.]
MVRDDEMDSDRESIDIFRTAGLTSSDIRVDFRDQMERQSQRYAVNDYVAIFDKRNLDRECLANSLDSHQIGISIFTFSGLTSWQQRKGALGTLRAALLNIGSNSVTDPGLRDEITQLVTTLEPVPVVVLSDNQDIEHVLQVIDLGVHGLIPSTVDIDVCIEAIGLAIAGGQFVPASSVLAMRGLLGSYASRKICGSAFTVRQAAVAEALRRGKANKMIARELNLCESTVKVHIRNIMKKLGATNRTEVACKVGEILSDETLHNSRA